MGVGTLFQAGAVWLIVYSFVVGAVEEARATPGPPLALGLALVPFAFVALALISGHPGGGSAVVAAMVLSVPLAVVVSALAQDAVSGTAAGFGAGAVVALRREYHHSRQWRIIAVVMMTTYVFALLRLVPAAGLLAGSLLPFVSVALADAIGDWRETQRGE